MTNRTRPAAAPAAAALPAPAPVPEFRAAGPSRGWIAADSPAAAAAAALADGAADRIPVEYRIGTGPWSPLLVFSSLVDFDAIRAAHDAR